MSSLPYLSAAFMVVDSYFIDEGVSIDLSQVIEYPDISPTDAMNLAIGAYVIEHTSNYDLITKDVI